MPIAMSNKIDPNADLIIVPNLARKKTLEEYIIGNVRPAIWGENIHTVSTLASSLAGALKISSQPILEKAIIYKIVKETKLRYFNAVKDEQSIREQFFFAITTLRKNMISSDELEAVMSDKGSLKEFDLLTVFKQYEEEIEKLGLSDEGQDLKNATTTISGGALKNINHLVFDGFELLTPAVTKLIEAIDKGCPETKVKIVANHLPNSPIFDRYKDLINRPFKTLGLDHISNTENDSSWTIPENVGLHACRSLGDEARFIALKISEMIKSGKDAKQIGILSCLDPSDIRTIASTLIDYKIIREGDVNLTEGRLDLIKEIIQNSSTIDEIEERLKEKISTKMTRAFRSGPHIEAISQSLKITESIFNLTFSLRALPEESRHTETIKKLILNEIDDSAKGLVKPEGMPIRWLWWDEDAMETKDHIFIPSACQGKIPPEERPSIFFQDSSFLPANAPIYFSQLFPQPEMIRAKGAYKFRKHLSTATDSIVFSFSKINKEGKEVFPSNILTMLGIDLGDTLIEEKHTNHPVQEHDTTSDTVGERITNELSTKERPKLEPPSVIRSEEIKAEINKRFKDHVFSASQLERYVRCPYQFYLNKVVKLQPIETPTPEIDPRHRGTIIHYILELFYKNELDLLLKFFRKEAKFNELGDRIDEYTDKAIDDNGDLLKETHTAIVNNFKKRAKEISKEALLIEINLIDKMVYPLLPKYTEWKFGIDETPALTLKTPDLNPPAQIKGIVDRIDVDMENKAFSITDYKTGNTESIIGKIRKGEHLQLPLYIEAVKRLLLKDEKPVGAFLFSLKIMEKKHGIALEETKSYYFPKTNPRLFVNFEEWDELIDTAISHTAKYINDIRNSEFRENSTSCARICDYKDICRYER